MGAQGRVLFHLSNSLPIVQVEVKIGGQVIGEIDGQELRSVAGIYFSVPRVAAAYTFSVFAKDTSGCTAETTTVRSFTVTP